MPLAAPGLLLGEVADPNEFFIPDSQVMTAKRSSTTLLNTVVVKYSSSSSSSNQPTPATAVAVAKSYIMQSGGSAHAGGCTLAAFLSFLVAIPEPSTPSPPKHLHTGNLEVWTGSGYCLFCLLMYCLCPPFCMVAAAAAAAAAAGN